MPNFYNFFTSRSILDLNVSLTGSCQDLQEIILNYFSTIGINEHIYLYEVTPDLFYTCSALTWFLGHLALEKLAILMNMLLCHLI